MAARARLRYVHGELGDLTAGVAVIRRGGNGTALNVLLHFGVARARHFGD